MAGVGILAVDTVGGDLVQLAADQDRYSAVALADGDGAIVREHPLDLVGLSGGREIPVVRLYSPERVAHTAAHGITAIAAVPELINDQFSVLR